MTTLQAFAAPAGLDSLRGAAIASARWPATSRTCRVVRPKASAAAGGERPDAPGSAPGGVASRLQTRKSQYDQLTALTTVVEDTGDINAIAEHRPFAATTNPSLVYAAADRPEYESLVRDAVAYGRGVKSAGGAEGRLAIVRNALFARFGARILEIVPGDVSTEVDARLSFDVDAQITTALQIIDMYKELGVDKDRVLIKLATTWEGVQACRELQSQGIKTNMTLLFGMAQAAAAADAGAYLISPFVGRILDWYKKAEGRDSYPDAEDPGVLSVRNIYNYYKCLGYDTIVMGASFRNKGEILQLAGCDRLTISPKFIADLQESYDPVPHLLNRPAAEACNYDPMPLDEKAFRWAMNEDAMATEKLAEGIRGFAADLVKLDSKLSKLMI
jgi:transaldolase